MINTLYLAIFVTMVSVTVVRTAIFEPFRDWVDEATDTGDALTTSMWYKLVSCTYCMAFWVTALARVILPSLWDTTIPLPVQGSVVWFLSSLLCPLVIWATRTIPQNS